MTGGVRATGWVAVSVFPAFGVGISEIVRAAGIRLVPESGVRLATI